jgi:predicted AAA+ superfamily ATPase
MLIMLRATVAKQKEDKERLMNRPYIQRTKESEAEKLRSSDLIKVILGPRRAGKSVFAFLLLKDKDFAYFNFDDESAPGDEKIDLDELMAELKHAYGDTTYILFDEIQNLPKWELFVNRLHRAGYNLVITGSNAQMLSRELATHLTGRHVPIEILPFDFKEILCAKDYTYDHDTLLVPGEKGRLLTLVAQYLTNGGYPEVVTKDLDPRGYLDILFDAVLFKDVVKRHNVRFPEQIGNLGSYLMNNFASLYSPKRLANLLGFKSQVTLENYLTYFTEAYLVFSLRRYSTKVSQRLRAPKKTYVVDTGFITAKAVQHSPNTGKLMENLVFTELVKRGKEPNRDLFYFTTKNGREVDFVVKDGYLATELIQVCYDLSSPDVEEREMRALFEAGKELDVVNLTILTWNDRREMEKDGMIIQVIPLWKWLTD